MALLTKEIKINHQVSMKMDLTRKKFEIQKSSEALSVEKLRQRERKWHFLKKEKLKLRHAKIEKNSHTLQIEQGHMFIIWQGGRIAFIAKGKTSRNEGIQTITSDHIPVLVHYIDENGIGGQLTNM